MSVMTIPQATIIMGMEWCGSISLISQLKGISRPGGAVRLTACMPFPPVAVVCLFVAATASWVDPRAAVPRGKAATVRRVSETQTAATQTDDTPRLSTHKTTRAHDGGDTQAQSLKPAARQ